MPTVTLKGRPLAVHGALPAKGDVAPDFCLADRDLADRDLSAYAGKRKVLNIVPSLDTPTCQQSARVFNERASSVENTVVLVISADLPFAMARFCGAEGLDNVEALSTFRSRDFHRRFGVDIAEGPLRGLTARAVVVLSPDNRVLHAELVPEITDEPDYQAALSVLQ